MKILLVLLLLSLGAFSLGALFLALNPPRQASAPPAKTCWVGLTPGGPPLHVPIGAFIVTADDSMFMCTDPDNQWSQRK